MRIKNGKDFWAGVMFVGLGFAFMLGSLNYPIGSATRMGPGYFPAVLGGLLALIGAGILCAHLQPHQHFLLTYPFRPILFIASMTIAMVAYFTKSHLHGTAMVQVTLAGLSVILFYWGVRAKADGLGHACSCDFRVHSKAFGRSLRNRNSGSSQFLAKA